MDSGGAGKTPVVESCKVRPERPDREADCQRRRAPVRARYTMLMYKTNIYLGTKDSLALETTSVQDAGTSNREADETETTTARRIHALQQHPA